MALSLEASVAHPFPKEQLKHPSSTHEPKPKTTCHNHPNTCSFSSKNGDWTLVLVGKSKTQLFGNEPTRQVQRKKDKKKVKKRKEQHKKKTQVYIKQKQHKRTYFLVSQVPNLRRAWQSSTVLMNYSTVLTFHITAV